MLDNLIKAMLHLQSDTPSPRQTEPRACDPEEGSWERSQSVKARCFGWFDHDSILFGYGVELVAITWNLNDLYFGPPASPNMVFSYQHRGQMGCINIYREKPAYRWTLYLSQPS